MSEGKEGAMMHTRPLVTGSSQTRTSIWSGEIGQVSAVLHNQGEAGGISTAPPVSAARRRYSRELDLEGRRQYKVLNSLPPWCSQGGAPEGELAVKRGLGSGIKFLPLSPHYRVRIGFFSGFFSFNIFRLWISETVDIDPMYMGVLPYSKQLV